MRDFPKLSWINAKTAPQQNGGRKNNPGRKEENITAIVDELRLRAKEIRPDEAINLLGDN